jgi:protein-tyrosine phosphatase
MHGGQQRRLDFEGAVNFRDMGGYPAADGRRTRWRRLYRSDSLADLSPADIEKLGALGLHTLIDFRLPAERQLKPNRLPPGESLKIVELGFVPAGTLDMLGKVRDGSIDSEEVKRRVTAQYRLLPVDHNGEYQRVFEIASQAEGYPFLIHCTSGKDRTGFGVAALLLSVGVPREIVLEDYGLTNQYRRPVPQLFGPNTSEAVVRTLLSAQPQYLQAALDEIDSVYGSFDRYVEKGLGLGAAGRARLVDLLTEPDAGGVV